MPHLIGPGEPRIDNFTQVAVVFCLRSELHMNAYWALGEKSIEASSFAYFEAVTPLQFGAD